MTAAPVDLSTYTDDELTDLASQVRDERSKRATIANAHSQISDINAKVLQAQGVSQGEPWVQPTDATNAYPIDWTVTYNGKTWKSLIAANTTIPGDPADPQSYRWWQDMTPVPPTSGPPAWSGAGVAYAVGDQVTYNGQTYQCLQAHTSQPDWTPDAVPALWQLVAAS